MPLKKGKAEKQINFVTQSTLQKVTNMDIKKQAAVEAYVKAFGNVTKAAAAIDMSRKTFYDWLKNDPEFKEAIDEAKPLEYQFDFVEDMFFQLIKEKNTAAIIFYLKTKGKEKGYVEQTNIHQTIESLPEIILLPPNNAKPAVYDEADVTDIA